MFCIGRQQRTETVEACLQYLTEISQAAYFHLARYYLSAFGKINSKLVEDLKELSDKEKEKKKKGHYLYKLDQKIESFWHDLPVIGFYSGRYDINAMIIDFFSHLAERNLIKYAVKCNNTFMAVKAEIHQHRLRIPGMYLARTSMLDDQKI